MADILSIVKGNNILLKIPIQKAFVSDGNIEVEDFDLSQVDSLNVYLCRGNEKYENSYQTDGNVLIIPIDGTKIKLGTYAIEIIAIKDSENYRSKQLTQFRIVDSNGETNLPSDVEFSYTVYNLQGVCVTACGDSAYDIAVKNGFVGTEQEWLDSLKADITKQNIEDVLVGDIKSHNHDTQMNNKLSLYATIELLNANIEALQKQLDVLNSYNYFIVKR
jgi:hypothetical protein